LGTLSATIEYLGHTSIATDISIQACAYALCNIQRYTPHASIICCDWRYPPFKTHFDCIVGSDILYEKRWIEPIVEFLKNHIVSGGKAIIADPGRPYWLLFKHTAIINGFIAQKSDFVVTHSSLTPVEILHLKKNAT
jgi:predicted nicotinamide N-methyase